MLQIKKKTINKGKCGQNKFSYFKSLTLTSELLKVCCIQGLLFKQQ